MNENILRTICISSLVAIGSISSVSALAAPETITTTVTKSIVKSAKTSVDAAKSITPKKLKTDDTLKLISRTDNEYGVIQSYVDVTSIRPSDIVVTDDKDGRYRKAVIVTVYNNGLIFNNGMKVYSTVEQGYISCADNAFYQNKILASDVNGNATYEWSSDKTALVKSDFSLSQKNSIYDKSLAEICAFDITGKISK